MKTLKLISFFIFFSITLFGQNNKIELWKLHRQQSLIKTDSLHVYHLSNGKMKSQFGDFNKNDTMYYSDNSILRTAEASNGYLNGNLIYYFQNGKVYSKSKLKESEYYDTSFYYNNTGNLTMLTVYNDTRHRTVTGYYNSGEIKNIQKIVVIEEINNNPKDSISFPKLKSVLESDIYFDKSGKEISFDEYMVCLKNDLINNPPVSANNPLIDQMPSFPGGESEMRNFLIKNIKYPKSEKRKGISGICYVSFVVEKDGSINEVKILRGIKDGPKCNAEAIRVVQLMPNWIPGKMDGKLVRVQFNLPIKFNLTRLN